MAAVRSASRAHPPPWEPAVAPFYSCPVPQAKELPFSQGRNGEDGEGRATVLLMGTSSVPEGGSTSWSLVSLPHLLPPETGQTLPQRQGPRQQPNEQRSSFVPPS